MLIGPDAPIAFETSYICRHPQNNLADRTRCSYCVLRSMESAQYYAENNLAMARRWIEIILQALEYENEQNKDLEEFLTAGKFQTDLGKSWASEIAWRRKKQD